MKLPSDETPANSTNMNGDGYNSDEYEPLEMMPIPVRDGDFSEYMWMENEEEFNSEVLRQLEEEELMEQCIVAMLDDEEYQMSNSSSNSSRNHTNGPNAPLRNNIDGTSSTTSAINGLSESVNTMSISANGIRNNANVSSDNHVETSNSHSFSAQDRLRRHRSSTENTSHGETSESEQKSNLNPDAKEFVPLLRSVQFHSRNENVHF